VWSFPGLVDISAVLPKSVPLSDEVIIEVGALWGSSGIVFSEGQEVTFIDFSEMAQRRHRWTEKK